MSIVPRLGRALLEEARFVRAIDVPLERHGPIGDPAQRPVGDRERVMAGTDCGFSIHVGSGGVDPDVVWAKLAVLAEGAAIATKKFWPGR